MTSVIVSLVVIAGVTFVLICTFKNKGRSCRVFANLSAFFLLVYGAFSFSSMFWSSSVSNDFEWPMGFASCVIKLSDGRKIAVSEAHGRIQIYDHEYSFINGFSIDAGGGVFKVRKAEGNTLEIQTARGDKRIVYDLNGNVISKQRLEASSYSKFRGSGGARFVPTPIYLLPFTNPIIAWGFAALGGGLLFALNFDVFKERSVSRNIQQGGAARRGNDNI